MPFLNYHSPPRLSAPNFPLLSGSLFSSSCSESEREADKKASFVSAVVPRSADRSPRIVRVFIKGSEWLSPPAVPPAPGVGVVSVPWTSFLRPATPEGRPRFPLSYQRHVLRWSWSRVKDSCVVLESFQPHIRFPWSSSVHAPLPSGFRPEGR